MLGAQSGQEIRTWTLDEEGRKGQKGKCQKGGSKDGHCVGMFQEPILLVFLPHLILLQLALPPVPRRALRRGISCDRSERSAHTPVKVNTEFLEQPEPGGQGRLP